MIKNYKQYNEGIKSLLVGPTEEEISINLKNKYNEDGDATQYLISLVKLNLIDDILNVITELDYNEKYLPLVIIYAYIYNKTDLITIIWETYKIDLELFDIIKKDIKQNLRIKLLDNTKQIYNELDEIERILKYRSKI